MQKIKQKLSSSKGETLAEVMVASLIAGLGLLLLATMIMSSSRIITNSEKSMKAYYTSISTVEQAADEAKDDTITVEIIRQTGKNTISDITGIQQYTAKESDTVVLRAYGQ